MTSTLIKSPSIPVTFAPLKTSNRGTLLKSLTTIVTSFEMISLPSSALIVTT
jgi:hypothetical protein